MNQLQTIHMKCQALLFLCLIYHEYENTMTKIWFPLQSIQPTKRELMVRFQINTGLVCYTLHPCSLISAFVIHFSLNILYLITSLHVYKQEHTYKSITEFIKWDSERSLDDLFKSVSHVIRFIEIIIALLSISQITIF